MPPICFLGIKDCYTCKIYDLCRLPIYAGGEMMEQQACAGQFLKVYEGMRYTDVERSPFLNIIVQPDAEQFADLSLYQAGTNWAEYKKHARAAIIRLGQNTWKDPEFETNYSEARRVGVLLGGYFFFDGRATPQAQADVIIKAMNGKFLDMELFIDWEKNYGGQNEGLPNVVSLMQKCELAGIKCKAVGMYTGYYWFGANSNASTNAAQYAYLRQRPLWLAWYAAASVVKVPAPWTDWTHWQYGTPVLQWGQTTQEIDMNRHNGTRDQFTARYVTQTEPTEGDDDMAITPEQWAQLITKLGDIEKAIKAIPGNPGTPTDPGTPPADPMFSVYRVVEHDVNPNQKVVVYKVPDVNDTNKDTIWVGGKPQEIKVYTRWQDVPAGLVYWKDLNEMHKMNTYDEWAYAVSTWMWNANGVRIAFPNIFISGGVRASGCWIHRADLGAKLG